MKFYSYHFRINLLSVVFGTLIFVGFETIQSKNTVHRWNHKEQGISFRYYCKNMYQEKFKKAIFITITVKNLKNSYRNRSSFIVLWEDRPKEIHLRIHLKIDTDEASEKNTKWITTQHELRLQNKYITILNETEKARIRSLRGYGLSRSLCGSKRNETSDDMGMGKIIFQIR